ncbi:hypothetical protein J6590_039525 [Homalodisca vitripennis]|nr:hypothetical protein J6590_039525 [Homalodisca vitripennis]
MSAPVCTRLNPSDFTCSRCCLEGIMTNIIIQYFRNRLYPVKGKVADTSLQCCQVLLILPPSPASHILSTKDIEGIIYASCQRQSTAEILCLPKCRYTYCMSYAECARPVVDIQGWSFTLIKIDVACVAIKTNIQEPPTALLEQKGPNFVPKAIALVNNINSYVALGIGQILLKHGRTVAGRPRASQGEADTPGTVATVQPRSSRSSVKATSVLSGHSTAFSYIFHVRVKYTLTYCLVTLQPSHTYYMYGTSVLGLQSKDTPRTYWPLYSLHTYMYENHPVPWTWGGINQTVPLLTLRSADMEPGDSYSQL